MGRIENFEDLEVWQRARKICIYIETLFSSTLLGKNWSMRDQMERSSGSIMDNIAEGFSRDGNKEFHNFLSYSKGSAGELASQAYRAFDKKLINKNKWRNY
jgi:four helix bundle protein